MKFQTIIWTIATFIEAVELDRFDCKIVIMEVKIEGQVIQIRKSEDQNVAFFDIDLQTLLDDKLKDSDEEPEPSTQRICVALKSLNCGEEVLKLGAGAAKLQRQTKGSSEH